MLIRYGFPILLLAHHSMLNFNQTTIAEPHASLINHTRSYDLTSPVASNVSTTDGPSHDLTTHTSLTETHTPPVSTTATASRDVHKNPTTLPVESLPIILTPKSWNPTTDSSPGSNLSDSQDYLAALSELLQGSTPFLIGQQGSSQNSGTGPTSTTSASITQAQSSTIVSTKQSSLESLAPSPLSQDSYSTAPSTTGRDHPTGTTVMSLQPLAETSEVESGRMMTTVSQPQNQTPALIKCYECTAVSADNCVAGTCFGVMCSKVTGSLQDTIIVQKGCITTVNNTNITASNNETTCRQYIEMGVNVESCYCQEEYCNSAPNTVLLSSFGKSFLLLSILYIVQLHILLM